MARINAIDESRNLYEKLRGGISSTVNRVGSFVRQNPTPVGYAQKKLDVRSTESPYQYIQRKAPQSFVAQYTKGQIAQPIQQGFQQIQQPGFTNRALGAAQIIGGGFAATPQGALWNVGTGVTAGIGQAIRQRQNPLPLIRSASTQPTSFATTGLGVQNPYVALGVDLLSPSLAGKGRSIINASKVQRLVAKEQQLVTHARDLTEKLKSLQAGKGNQRAITQIEKVIKNSLDEAKKIRSTYGYAKSVGQTMGIVGKKDVTKGRLYDVPKELEPFKSQINNLRMTKDEFLKQVQDGLKEHNLTRRDRAQGFVKAIKDNGMTLDDFYAASIKDNAIMNPVKPSLPPSTGGEINPLIQEARKYKSAEEFVKAQGETMFRSSASPFDVAKMGDDGVFISPDKPFVERWQKAQGYKNFEEFVISPEAKILKRENFPKKFVRDEGGLNFTSLDDQADIIKYAKENGFDGIEDYSIRAGQKIDHEFAVWNKDVLKTKSQLTDLWKKAQASGGEIPKGGEMGKGVTDKIPQQVALTTKGIPKESPISPQQPQGGGGLPSGQGIPPSGSSISQDPVQKIVDALKGAKPLRGKQEALYSKERAARVARVAGVGEKIPGEKGYFAQLGQLKGELPKVEFEGIRKQIKQPDIDALFNKVEQSNLPVFEKITAKTGLAKLLGAEGGRVPTKGEMALLGEIFPPEFTKAILDKRSTWEKLFQVGQEALSIPKAMRATADFSAAFRQGIALIGRPRQFAPAFKEMFRYAFSDKAYKGGLDEIRARSTYSTMKEAGVSFTEIGGALSKREETYMSTLPEKIPLFGSIVKGSNRAYTGFLNKIRADVFDDILKNAKTTGVEVTPKLTKDIAKFVNSASGRGDLGALNRSGTVLNAMFFSPRLMASRLNLLNPVYYAKLDPFVRKEALKTVLSSAGIIGAIATAAKVGGLDVGTDPRSADFLKVKYGNTRWDIGGGFAQYLRLAAQLVTGELISTTTGRKITLGEGYKPITRAGIVGNFVRGKLDPVAGMTVSALTGKDFLGKDFNAGKEALSLITPLQYQDMKDLIKEYGPKGILAGLPGLVGVGSQTYSPISDIGDNPTINEQTKLRKTATDYYIRGQSDKALQVMKKYGIQLDPHEVKLAKAQKTRLAADAYVAEDQKEALAIMKDYRLQLSEKDVATAAKKKAASLYREEKLDEALVIMRKYKIQLTPKDIE